MEVAFTFRNVESSEGVKNYAREKISRLQKNVRAPLNVDIVLSHERHLHRVEVAMAAGGNRYAGAHESADMYASIDLVVDKLDRQMRDSKQEATDRKKHSGGVAQMSGKLGRGGNEF